METRYDLVIVGMGSGGMVAAALATKIGLRVAAVERDRVGGDCLWTGCVPSKALLAAAKVAHHLRESAELGLTTTVAVDRAEVWKRVRAVQADIAATDDDPDRYRAMGLEIVAGRASLRGPHTVHVELAEGGTRDLETRFVLLCTGSRPAVPSIPGLAEAGFLTSETLWDLEEPPARVAVVGGGPIGVEMAQACARLGIATILLQKGPRLLPRDDPALVATLTDVLRRDGVDVGLNVDVERVERVGADKVVRARVGDEVRTFAADEILVAAGRTPNVEGLDLDQVGIRTGPRGIEVDASMRTSVPSVYAAGDVAGRYLFTHSAATEGVRAVRNMFFPGRQRKEPTIPWATFTDPELAHAGFTVAEASQKFGAQKVRELRWELAHNDRARADGNTEGAIVMVLSGSRIVGAQILAPGAGDLIHELVLAIEQRCTVSDIANLVHIYPTLATSFGQLAAEVAFEKAAKYKWLTRLTRR
ncbi:MAG: FAD-dependent oxidoreductase [Actinomycetota bacterium]|nr:FAD-dependent oxidoreductase [Actinomycetota bacterium]